MVNRTCFRIPKIKDKVTIPDGVETIEDLRHYIGKVLNTPIYSFKLRAWTNQCGLKKTKTQVHLKDERHIIDLEDNHSGRKPLLITVVLYEHANERRKEVRKMYEQVRAEDRYGQFHIHKQARLDQIVCGICN